MHGYKKMHGGDHNENGNKSCMDTQFCVGANFTVMIILTKGNWSYMVTKSCTGVSLTKMTILKQRNYSCIDTYFCMGSITTNIVISKRRHYLVFSLGDRRITVFFIIHKVSIWGDSAWCPSISSDSFYEDCT